MKELLIKGLKENKYEIDFIESLSYYLENEESVSISETKDGLFFSVLEHELVFKNLDTNELTWHYNFPKEVLDVLLKYLDDKGFTSLEIIPVLYHIQSDKVEYLDDLEHYPENIDKDFVFNDKNFIFMKDEIKVSIPVEGYLVREDSKNYQMYLSSCEEKNEKLPKQKKRTALVGATLLSVAASLMNPAMAQDIDDTPALNDIDQTIKTMDLDSPEMKFLKKYQKKLESSLDSGDTEITKVGSKAMKSFYKLVQDESETYQNLKKQTKDLDNKILDTLGDKELEQINSKVVESGGHENPSDAEEEWYNYNIKTKVLQAKLKAELNTKVGNIEINVNGLSDQVFNAKAETIHVNMELLNVQLETYAQSNFDGQGFDNSVNLKLGSHTTFSVEDYRSVAGDFKEQSVKVMYQFSF